MNAYELLYAIGDVEDVYIQNAREHIEKRKRIPFFKWGIAAAACLLVVLLAVPVLNIFAPHHTPAPPTIDYDTLDEVREALGRGALYDKLALDGGSISVSYQSDDAGEARLDAPLQLLIRQKQGADSVRYYILFGLDDVEDSYLDGYYGDGLTKEVGGITVSYFYVFDGMNHAQAKFVYEDDLYVIDVTSSEEIDLDAYLEMVLH